LRFESDQQLHVFAWLLLRYELSNLGYPVTELLRSLIRSKQNKPELPALDWKFNLSHSGRRVICALAPVEVGADIERVRSVKFKDLSRVMNQHQWDEISAHENPMKKFFEYWTIKESVIKADGRGLSMNLEKMQIHAQTVQYEAQVWYYQLLSIPQYSACVALDRPFEPPKYTERSVEELMKYRPL
jgi:4'-phosphopantetheinyl transferase